MASATHERAVEWVAERLDAELVGQGTYHLRDPRGRRIRVAGRHIEARQPNFFPIGSTLEGDPFDELAVVLFAQDWSVSYAYLLPMQAVRIHHKQPGAQGPRLKGDDSWRSDPLVEELA